MALFAAAMCKAVIFTLFGLLIRSGFAFSSISAASFWFFFAVMGSNKFVALTHLMIQFSLEKSLINEEIDPKNLEESFREDMVYQYK